MGMGGVQRTAKFVKYLPDYGWKPLVLTVTPKQYLAKDECLLEDLDNGHTQIFRTGSLLSNNLQNEQKIVKFSNDRYRKFLSNLSQVFLIPDSKILWKKDALNLAEKVISENKIELIYATAPPYTDFLAAYELKKKFGLPVVIDYRDSWIDCPNNFYLTPFHKRAHYILERKVLESADKIITINRRIKELIIEKYPFVEDADVVVIPQGFDPDDFNREFRTSEPKQKMRFTYAGSFLNYYTPEYFLKALSSVFESRPELKNKIEVCFIGSFPEEYKGFIEQYGVSNAVNLLGYLEHSECIDYEMNSDVLWMMIRKTNRSDLHSTGKLYEYFGARKPILACVPDGVARESLKEHGAVKMCQPDDVRAIAGAIIEFYELYRNKALPKPDNKLISAYDRRKLTGELAARFKDLVSDSESAKSNRKTTKEGFVHT
jgi:glycosyltransferase involved in cell wall biosynthesis